MPPIHQISYIHAKDVGWLIALYIAIHGGDPPHGQQASIPVEAVQKGAVGLIRALTNHLEPAQAKAVVAALDRSHQSS